MELFGLLFAVPVTLVASFVYVGLIFLVFPRWVFVRKLCVVASYGIIALVLLETGLLLVLGAKFTYWHLGQIYTAIHFINFLLAPPAIANVVFVFINKDVKRQFLAFAVSCLCCWIACMSVLLVNIGVDEAIVGIDAPESFNMTKPERPDTIPQSQFQSSGIP
jgi:hypothetical protein